MFVYSLTQPVDEFDGLTTLPDWLHGASPHATRWRCNRSSPSPTPPMPSAGAATCATYPPSASRSAHPPRARAWSSSRTTTAPRSSSPPPKPHAPWIAADAAACTRVAAREIGAWTHPTHDDIPTYHDDSQPTTSALVTGAPF